MDQRPDGAENHAGVPQSVFDQLPAMVRHELSVLPGTRQAEFLEEYHRQKKSVIVSYVLWFVFGLYYGYLGRWGLQILYWLTGGGFGLS